MANSCCSCTICSHSFSFQTTATTEIYTLSLHDALPIYNGLSMALERTTTWGRNPWCRNRTTRCRGGDARGPEGSSMRSAEQTSELQSQSNKVFRLLLEQKSPSRPGDHPASQPAGGSSRD